MSSQRHANASQTLEGVNIARAWKDETYRESLSPAQRNALPAHPAGMMEITESESASISGACALQTTLDIYTESIGTTCHCPARIVLRNMKVG